MKESRFNYYTDSGENVLCLNGISSLVFSLKKEECDFMRNLMKNEELQQEYPELTKKLARGHFLINNEEDEINCLKDKVKKMNTSGTWHLTLNPTLDCNFKCWYCYEQHPHGRMSQETMDRVMLLMNRIAEDDATKRFDLAWFGGEPLLYFNQVVYPLSLYAKKCMEERNILFFNSMTTNGYLLSRNVIAKCHEIGLKHFQITLDGNREMHDGVRNQGGKPSFDRILKNSIEIAASNPEVRIMLRVNYTTESIQEDYSQVLSAIPLNIRKQFWVQFQRVWQTYEKEGSDERVRKVIDENFACLKRHGFNVSFNTTFRLYNGMVCYADRANYANINYDGKIYRCTAQDYLSTEPLGYLNESGEIIWKTEEAKNFCGNAFWNNPLCLKCDILPLCGGPCFSKWWSDFRQGALKECPLKKVKIDQGMDTFIREFYDNRIKTIAEMKQNATSHV